MASWVLAFLLPSLLFRFTDPAANTVRRATMLCFVAILFGKALLLFYRCPCSWPAFPRCWSSGGLSASPSAGGETDPNGHGKCNGSHGDSRALSAAKRNDAGGSTQPLRDVVAARALGTMSKPGETSVSDQPWLAAWYADRPSVWIPAEDARTEAIAKQFTGMRWLFLTARARGYSDRWMTVHELFRRWNVTYAGARRAKTGKLPPPFKIKADKAPLSPALAGFMPVAPVENTLLSTVLAHKPADETNSSLGSVPGKK